MTFPVFEDYIRNEQSYRKSVIMQHIPIVKNSWAKESNDQTSARLVSSRSDRTIEQYNKKSGNYHKNILTPPLVGELYVFCIPTFYCAGGTRGRARCFFRILLEEWGELDIINIMRLQGEKMDIMCEGETL